MDRVFDCLVVEQKIVAKEERGKPNPWAKDLQQARQELGDLAIFNPSVRVHSFKEAIAALEKRDFDLVVVYAHDGLAGDALKALLEAFSEAVRATPTGVLIHRSVPDAYEHAQALTRRFNEYPAFVTSPFLITAIRGILAERQKADPDYTQRMLRKQEHQRGSASA